MARDTLFDQPLPHSAEAERAILGDIILDNRLMDQALALLRPEYFATPSHLKIYCAMIELHERNTEINPVLIGELLRRENSLTSVGGISAITDLTYGLQHSSSLAHYAQVLRQKHIARWGIKEAYRLAEEFFEGENEPTSVVAKAAEHFAEMTEKAASNGLQGGHLAELIPQIQDYLYLLKAGVNPAVSTGLSDLDHLTGGGIAPGQVWSIGALSSRGKTVLLVQVLRHMAKQGIYVALFSLEKRALAIALRILASETGVPRYKIGFEMKQSEIDWLLEEAPKHFTSPFFLYTDCRSVIDIKRRLETLNRKLAPQGKRVKAVGIDYYGLLSGYGAGRDRYENRTQELKYIASFCQQQIALDQEVGLILPAQFNRSAWNMKEPGPGQIDGGEALFQASDLYATLQSKEVKQGAPTAEASLIVYKQSDGPRGTIKLTFHGPKMEFYKREEDEDEPEKPDIREAMNDLNDEERKDYL